MQLEFKDNLAIGHQKKVLDKLFDFCYNEPIKNEDGN